MAKRFTEDLLKKLAQEGKIKGYAVQSKHKSPDKPPLPPMEPNGVTYIKKALDKAGIGFVTEFKFSSNRNFKFDIAIMHMKLAIEYEGLFSAKSRHTTAEGYSMDAEKYNLAQQMGWQVYRYTAVNYKNIDLDMWAILKMNKQP